MKKYLIAILGVALLTAGCNKTLPPEPPYPVVEPLQVDDFENGDNVNDIKYAGFENIWENSAVNGSTLTAYGLSGGSGGKYGSYCWGMTGTVKERWNGYLAVDTGTKTSVSTGIDIRRYNKFKFSLSLVSDAPSGVTHTCELNIGTASPAFAIFENFNLTPDGQWHDFEINLNDIRREIGIHSGAVLENINYIHWETWIISGNYSDSANIELYIDNIRFE